MDGEKAESILKKYNLKEKAEREFAKKTHTFHLISDTGLLALLHSHQSDCYYIWLFLPLLPYHPFEFRCYIPVPAYLQPKYPNVQNVPVNSLLHIGYNFKIITVQYDL